jgi:hypothetical protein
LLLAGQAPHCEVLHSYRPLPPDIVSSSDPAVLRTRYGACPAGRFKASQSLWVEPENWSRNTRRKAGYMSPRFWRPSLNKRVAAKPLVASLGMLTLLVGLLTTSGHAIRAPSASVWVPQPQMAGQPHSTTVQTFVHNSSVPRFDTFAGSSGKPCFSNEEEDDDAYRTAFIACPLTARSLPRILLLNIVQALCRPNGPKKIARPS